MKISVIGGGYVGLVSGACFTELGHNVTIIDTDPDKVRQITAKKSPFFLKIHPKPFSKNTLAIISMLRHRMIP